jgi:uncharacterized protein (TIGR03067 family)
MLAATIAVTAGTATAADLPQQPAVAKATGAAKSDRDALQGVWAFDSAFMGQNPSLQPFWKASVTIEGDAVTVNGFVGLKTPLKGTLKLDPTATPKRFELVLEGYDLAKTGIPMKIPAGAYPGIYELDGERVRAAFASEIAGPRPTAFVTGDKVFSAKLLRTPTPFRGFPKEVVVTAVHADGSPAAGAMVSGYIYKMPPAGVRDKDGNPIDPAKLPAETRKRIDDQNRVPEGAVRDEASGWIFNGTTKTGPDGTAKFKYDDCTGALVVRDPVTQSMGIATVTPASALRGPVKVTLKPERKVIVPASCAELTQAKMLGKDSFNSLVMTADGRRIGFTGGPSGTLNFLLPAGEYQVQVYGNELMGKATVKLVVPDDRSEYTAPPVTLPPSSFLALLGKPAPELTGGVGWKGEPVKLADLKGQYVLLEFWGWWCGPCIAHMPVLMQLHEKFRGKGVTIIGVHLDVDGEVTTAKQLDEKLVRFKADAWAGKDLPFPVILASGKRLGSGENAPRGDLAMRYGIQGYPSTVLIDREGKVASRFHADDLKSATELLEELLKATPK